MGRLDLAFMRYLTSEQARVLIAVEMGMKNHEIVPLPLIASVAGIHRGGVSRVLRELGKMRLVCMERGKRYDGFRLTKLGYDALALRALCNREIVGAVGNQIGVGKESDVYVGGDKDLNDLCLKFHRLGRTSFRKLKEKRDYHNRRSQMSWLYLSRIAATKEFAFLKALADANFPVPRPVDVCRHVVVMGLIDGVTLCHIDHLEDPGKLYDRCMSLIVKMARYGLIHGDFNEFNLMLVEDEKVIMIDFPQMVSMDHADAKYYFERDIECVRTLFKRKFDYDCDEYPKFEDMKRKYNLDVVLEASGFTRQMAIDLNKAYEDGNFRAHLEKTDCENDSEDEDEEEEGEEDQDEEDEEESEEEWVDAEEVIVEENEDDIDHEELEEEKKEAQRQMSVLGKSDRFNHWLHSAADQLEKLVVEEAGDSTLQEHPRERELVEEIRREREAYIKARQEADVEEAEKIDAELEEEERRKAIKEKKAKRGSVAGSRRTWSIASSTTTIAPEEIKKRAGSQARRVREHIKLKTKGMHSAVGRGRKENKEHIDDYAWMM